MLGERTYKITCDECGYSETVPQSRLPYEEGKPCPRCSKGRVYWVPLAEEARRREFWMPQERKVSPYWLIPVGLLLGVGGALGLAYAIARGQEEVPPEGVPPEEVPPEVPPSAFTFSNVSAQKVVMESAPAWETMNFYCTITNPSSVTITRAINVMVRWGDGSPHWQWSFDLTLGPGESYLFEWYGNTYGQRDPDAYNGPLVARRQTVCMWLQDDEGNKSPEGCVTGMG